jgi:aspartate aminotransferase-like enzyme
VPLFLSLREALRLLKEESLEKRIERTGKLANACRGAASALGMELFPEERFASNTVSAIRYPPGIEDAQFRNTLRDTHKVVIAGGQSHLKGNIFRIGHMGICSFSDLKATFVAIESVLKGMGHGFEEGSSIKAIEAAQG